MKFLQQAEAERGAGPGVRSCGAPGKGHGKSNVAAEHRRGLLKREGTGTDGGHTSLGAEAKTGKELRLGCWQHGCSQRLWVLQQLMDDKASGKLPMSFYFPFPQKWGDAVTPMLSWQPRRLL